MVDVGPEVHVLVNNDHEPIAGLDLQCVRGRQAGTRVFVPKFAKLLAERRPVKQLLSGLQHQFTNIVLVVTKLYHASCNKKPRPSGSMSSATREVLSQSMPAGAEPAETAKGLSEGDLLASGPGREAGMARSRGLPKHVPPLDRQLEGQSA